MAQDQRPQNWAPQTASDTKPSPSEKVRKSSANEAPDLSLQRILKELITIYIGPRTDSQSFAISTGWAIPPQLFGRLNGQSSSPLRKKTGTLWNVLKLFMLSPIGGSQCPRFKATTPLPKRAWRAVVILRQQSFLKYLKVLWGSVILWKKSNKPPIGWLNHVEPY